MDHVDDRRQRPPVADGNGKSVQIHRMNGKRRSLAVCSGGRTPFSIQSSWKSLTVVWIPIRQNRGDWQGVGANNGKIRKYGVGKSG